MKLILRGGRAARTGWAALALAAAIALSSHWLQNFRLASPERSASRVFRVTTGADSGLGSLREAIFGADRADGRARVVIDAPRITLRTPLPPLVNPAGVVIEGRNRRAVIDASGLRGGPVLDLVAPDCVIVGVRIERAADQAILIRKRGARLQDVVVVDSDVGVHQLDGAVDLTVEGSTFERNGVGMHVAADGAPVRIHNNRFRNHSRAAIWAIASKGPLPQQSPGVDVVRNEFSGDRQPVVLFNMRGQIERNLFESAEAAAVYANGARVIIRNNRVRAGRYFGIYLEQIDHGLVADNELDHNCAGGMILRNSQDTLVSSNRVYANGYGIILVHGHSIGPNTLSDNLVAQQEEDAIYIIGASPVLRHNRIFQNRKAALRLSSLATGTQQMLTPQPLLEENVLSGNGNNEVHRDEYEHSAQADTALATPPDCSWRLTTNRMQVASAGGQR